MRGRRGVCARTGTGERSLQNSTKEETPLWGARRSGEARSGIAARRRPHAGANLWSSSSARATTTSETTKRRDPARAKDTVARWSPVTAPDRRTQGSGRQRVLQQLNTASSSGRWTITPVGDTEATRAVVGHAATAAMADSCSHRVRGPATAAPNSCTRSASPLAATRKSVPAHRAVAQGLDGAASMERQ